MSVLASVEIRWFFQVLPDAMADYFDDSHQTLPRTDWYAIPSDPGCGIKIREGRLETKLQVASFGERKFGNAVGTVESWKKWSCLLPVVDSPTEDLLRSTNWQEVKKNRSIRRFAVDGNHVFEASEPPSNGCSFEWTKIETNQGSWNTIGFEAFGIPELQESNLTSVVEKIQEIKPLSCQFIAENSMNYVGWLNRLTAQVM